MKVTPETLRASQEIRDMLLPFDFAVVDNKGYGAVWFDTAPLQPFEIVAQRGSGCIYALTGPQRHVLLATSEGQAGIVAANLKECLELVVAHPYWQDILRFGDGDLSAMREVLRDRIEDFEEGALSDDPGIEEFCRFYIERRAQEVQAAGSDARRSNKDVPCGSFVILFRARADLTIAGAVPNPTLSASAGRSSTYDPSLCAGCSNHSVSVGVSDQAISDLVSGRRHFRQAVARAALEVSVGVVVLVLLAHQRATLHRTLTRQSAPAAVPAASVTVGQLVPLER